MNLDEAIDRYTNNAEYERTHGNLQGYLEFKQLAEWLKDYKRLLEQQSREDCISRQAALNSLIDNTTYLDGYDLAEALDAIENKEKLPPVTPQQKYGKWIKHPEIETSAPKYLMFYECSECGDKQCFCKPDIHKKRFCSNCGARMVDPYSAIVKKEVE